MNKENKKFVLENLIAFVGLLAMFFCIFLFNIKIGLTVFENIEKTPLFPLFIVVIIIIVIVVVVLIYVKKIKNKIGD